MWGFVLSGLLVGIMFGFVLQRGRYCVNTAFRDVIFINDFTLLRAYALGLIVTIIGANLIEDMGLLGGSGALYRQAFVPWANIIGGYIFGMGIVLAGGCGSGILYRIGEGLMAAVLAVFGFFFGIVTTKSGILKPIYEALVNENTVVTLKDGSLPTLYNFLSLGLGRWDKWVVIAVLTAVVVPFLLKGEPFKKAKKGYYWSTAGFLVGIVAIIAFWASAYFGGNARGLSFTGPMREFFFAVTLGDSQTSQIASMPIFGVNFSWSSLYVLGVPLGAYLSARFLKEFKLKVPPAEELLRVLLGGFVMGIGAQIGGGCNIGQGFTGVSTLAISSWVTTIFIVLGNWTMVYFLLIRPMRD
jgi:uncharacterized membrane protein YedE/YeeE